MEYQGKEKSYPRNVIIFERPIIFYDQLESFLWERFPRIHFEKKEQKGKGLCSGYRSTEHPFNRCSP